MSHSHEFVEERLPLYLTGDLSKDDMRAIEAHLVDCRSCADQLESTATSMAAVLAHGSAEPTIEKARFPWPAVRRAAAAAIIFGAGFFFGRGSNSPSAQADDSLPVPPTPTTLAAPGGSEPKVVRTSPPQVATRGIDQYAASDSPFAASLRALAALRRP